MTHHEIRPAVFSISSKKFAEVFGCSEFVGFWDTRGGGEGRGEQKRKMEFWKIVLCWMCSFTFFFFLLSNLKGTFFFFSWGAQHTPWVSKVCDVSGERGNTALGEIKEGWVSFKMLCAEV